MRSGQYSIVNRLKIAILCLVAVEAGNSYALDASDTEPAAVKPPQKAWHIQEELQHIKKNLDSRSKATEPDDLSKIEHKLNQIEKALGYEPQDEMASGIQQEDHQKSLRQTDDSLNSLKLDELNRIEKAFGYDAWMEYCEKSPGCKSQALHNKK